jgi:hypothetical protein
MPETEIIFFVQKSLEGGYVTRAIGHSIFTQGDTVEDLHRNVRDALLCHFDRDSVAYRLDFTVNLKA